MKKISILILITLIIFSSTISFAQDDIFIWNITKGKGYTNSMSDEDIIEINEDAFSGDMFGKRILGKLVNFNSYYDKLVGKYEECLEQGMDEDEIIDNLISNIPNIVKKLDDIFTKPKLENCMINNGYVVVEDNKIILNLDDYDNIDSMNFTFNHPVRVETIKIDGKSVSVEKYKDEIERYFGINDIRSFNKEVSLLKPLANIKAILSEFHSMEIVVENESCLDTKFLVTLYRK